MHFFLLQILLTLAYARHALSHPASSREDRRRDDPTSSSSSSQTIPPAVRRDWILPLAAGGLGFLGYAIGDIKGEHRGLRKGYQQGYQLGWRDLQDFQCVHECVEEKKRIELWTQFDNHHGPEDEFKFVFDDEKAQRECLDGCHVAPDSIIRNTPAVVREEFFRQRDPETTSNDNNGNGDGNGKKKTAQASDKTSDGTTTHHFSLPERFKDGVGHILGVLGHAGGQSNVVTPALGFKTPLKMNLVP